MYGYIYKTTNLINGKIYIGQHRANEFDVSYYGSGKYLRNAVNKYGVENFVVDVLEWCDTREQLNEREIFYIKHFNSREHSIGYNIARGGEGGDLVTCLPEAEYTKFVKKMSDMNKLGIIGNKGKHLSEQHKQRIGMGNKGKKHSDEWKKKHDDAVRGKTAWNKGLTKDDPRVAKYSRKVGEYAHSEEVRLKISQNMKHKENIGVYKRTEAQKQRLREVALGRIWVNNGSVARMIHIEELQKYLDNGFMKGRGKIK